MQMNISKSLSALCLLACFAAPSAVQAKVESCQTSIGGEQVGLFYDDHENVKGQTTLREKVFGGKGEITCPAYVTLRHLTPDLTDEDRAPFCLHYDKEAETYLGYAEGARGAYLACKDPSKAFCSRVNATKEGAVAIAGLAADKAADTVEMTEGIRKHQSGAVILSGSGSYVSGALGSLSSLGTTAMSVLTAPATVTAAAVTVVAVGGAVYVCREE